MKRESFELVGGGLLYSFPSTLSQLLLEVNLWMLQAAVCCQETFSKTASASINSRP